MAVVTGTTMDIQIDGTSATLINVTGYANSIDFAFPVDMLDTTVFGSTQKASIPGFGGGDDVVIGFRYDPTIEGQLAAVAAQQVPGTTYTVQISPKGTTTGNAKYTFETYLMNYAVKATPEAIDEITATFRKTGAYTRTTWA